MSVNLSYVKPRNSLSIASHKSDLCNAIVTRVKCIENFHTLLHDQELLVFCMNCVENALETKKIDKKELVLEVFNKIFEMTDDDQANISKSIEFLCNNKLIEKIPIIQKYSSIMSNYLKRKL